MKRTLWAVIGIGCTLMLLGQGNEASAAEAKKAETPAPTAPTPPPVQPAAKGGATEKGGPEKIVYTFENQDKMLEFTKLWQRRQGIVVRMTVLQAYWEQERADLEELNKKLSTDYKLDVTKNYSLDTERRVLIEREAPPAQESPKKDATKAAGQEAPKPAAP